MSRDRLIGVDIDDETLGASGPDAEHERRVAIFDLLEDNQFKVIDKGDNRLILRVGGGVGHVRHLVDLGDVLDTTLEGEFAYTLGASYVYQFDKDFGFLVTPDFIHLIGTSPSPQLDLTFGISMGF